MVLTGTVEKVVWGTPEGHATVTARFGWAEGTVVVPYDTRIRVGMTIQVEHNGYGRLTPTVEIVGRIPWEEFFP